MKKLTYSELYDIMYNHNIENGITSKGTDKNPIYGVAVISQESFSKEYSVEERSYKFSSDNKAFIPGMCSNSIFGSCLDGKDVGVRLDWYIPMEWKVEYCYLEEEN